MAALSPVREKMCIRDSRTAVPQIVSYAREHGAITAYDPNWRAPLWPNAEVGIHAMKSLLPLADVVKEMCIRDSPAPSNRSSSAKTAMQSVANC